MCHKIKIKFEYYKHCLEATQVENKINLLEKNKFDLDSLIETYIKKLILISQQRFRI